MTIGWKEYKCAELFEQVSTTKLKVKTKDCNPIGKYPVVDQGREKLAGFIDDEKRVISVSSPVCIFGDHTRVIKWIDFDFVPGADGTKILSPKSIINPRFFYYLLQNIPLIDKGYARHFKQLKEASVRVPEKTEQKRIADKLDSVLAKVEAAQARLDKIPAILKRFRQSVLAAATSGELSELNVDSWKQEKLIDILEVMADCPHTTPKWTEAGKICVRTSQFERFNLKLEESKFVSEETFLSRNSRHTPEAGDILYSREGAILGIACQIPEGVDLCLGQRMIVMRPNSTVNAEFLTLVLNSPLITNYIKTITIGNAAPRINMGTIKQFLIPVPSLKEQEQIVEKAGLFFELANTVENQYNTAKARLDKLNQSILARAFKGELFARSVKSEIKDIENSVEAIHA